MHLTIKLPSTSLEVDVNDDCIVENLRTVCAEKLKSVPENLCLVFKGKIMKDKDELQALGVTNGSAIHCAFKKAPASTQPTQSYTPQPNVSQPTQPVTTIPSSTETNYSSGPFTNLMSNLGNPNPAALQELLNTPDVVNILSDPNTLQNMMKLDPNIKAMLDSNPQLASVISNPETIKMILEIMKNPSLQQDLLRTYDQNLTQLQNVPGALNTFGRMFNNVTRGISSTGLLQSITGSNPTSSANTQTTANSITTSDSSTANTTGQALPNPWNLGSTQQQSATSSSSTSSAKPNDYLFRDTSRVLKLGNAPENTITKEILDKLQQKINSLSPRGQYALTEFVKGYELLREEYPELVVLMLNYQTVTLKQVVEAGVASEVTSAAQSTEIPPQYGSEESYKLQLEELNSMGFSDKDENIQALQFSYGDVSGAVNWILRRRGIQ